MRVVAQQWMSLDGYASGPDGEEPLFAAIPPDADAASQKWNDNLLDDVDAVLLGRRSYESFVQFWPTATEPIAARVNTIDKVVFSATLESAPWGDHPPATIHHDAVSYLRERRSTETTLLVWGSLALMHDLMAAGELDELDLFVAPAALGAGTPLIPAGTPLALTQLGGEIWPGATHLRYAVNRPAAAG
ncbi:dihydrofolate reductase family protein [Actinoplanes bogorensis]|uniref:Dihydrofolate reductase family protein n=1 Tax=Paractinoplanes bogorensis TaxID=1610840 RepID=A0ABS5YGR0_9ACTN|nr:dihydrofolate reductase family protein [Actinoplanes bogorensis]MBU2662652.1 dihydrofolate reductase family protein [Actinoplanes bogorensis]